MSQLAVVIGAGANELAAAHYLARAGYRALVLDARGVARSDDRSDVGWIPGQIVADLDLDRRGLTIHGPDPWITAPLPGGGRLELWRDMARSVEAIARVSRRDAAKWPQFCERMARLARLLQILYTMSPPDPMSRKWNDLVRLAGLGLRVRRLGRQGIVDLLRILPMSAADFLDDSFENDTLKGILGAAGVMHLHQGPRSGGTAFRLLHHHVGSPPGVFRPPLSNICRVLRDLPGIEVRSGAQVTAITVREGRVTAVALASGEEISTALVVSGDYPQRTLLELVDPGWLDPELARAVRNIRCRGVVARVTLALGRAPGFSRLVVAPSLDYLERGYDDAKYGRVSQAPYLEASSKGHAAAGPHRVELHVQYAPYALAGDAWGDEHSRALGELAMSTLTSHVPDLGTASIESVLTPRDLEAQQGYPEGQAEHAEPALDQLLWMRPTAGLSRYRTPIAGLYLCGPATHPGGGVPGACGYNAAREILRDRSSSEG